MEITLLQISAAAGGKQLIVHLQLKRLFIQAAKV
jgi:hypothetical protein